jgi:hypothetical protein
VDRRDRRIRVTMHLRRARLSRNIAPSLGKNRKGATLRALFLKALGIDRTDYFCGRLAGGMIPFMRRYSTIWP